jgi:hypothetical protein
MIKLDNSLVLQKERQPMLLHISVCGSAPTILEVPTMPENGVAVTEDITRQTAETRSPCHAGKEDKKLTKKEN